MAVLWIEGFEGFGTTPDVAPVPVGIVGRKYPSVLQESTFRIKTGRYGRAVQLNAICSMVSPALTTDPTMIFGCAIKVKTLPGVGFESPLITLMDGGDVGINVQLLPSGGLRVYKDNVLMGSSLETMSTGTWHYMELKTLVAASPTGTIELRVNEDVWYQVSNVVTQATPNTYHTNFRLAFPLVDTSYDDIYVLDGTGAINNDFLGPRRVDSIRPNAAGVDSDWTPDAGTNYERVNEVELDEDASYVETGVSGDQDLYGYDNTVNLTEITAIQVVAEAKVTSGSMELQLVTKSGATESTHSCGTIVSTDYITCSGVGELNPDTSLPWTPGEIDAAQFGVKAI